MGALADQLNTPVQRGIAALRAALGEDAALALLRPTVSRDDEVASYYYPLPVDYTGKERRLRIAFSEDFPRQGLRLTVEPSPWLVWPHATKTGLCLHDFQERPVTGTPEYVVSDSWKRLGKIVSLVQQDSCDSKRKGEFQREITSYWSTQQSLSQQKLVLLNRSEGGSELYGLSDPRQLLPSGQETVWLSSDLSLLKEHFRRTVGRSSRMRALRTPGFYVKLQSYPDLYIPPPEQLLNWLNPHLHSTDAAQLSTWFSRTSSLPDRWIILELPGDSASHIYCLNIRASGLQIERGAKFHLRSERHRPATLSSTAPALVRRANVNVLDRNEIFSRDLSGVTRTLADARVVCVGVGSLGSTVALQLARSGVGHLTLIDPEELVSANIGRHVLGAEELGLNKAEALQKRIRKDLPTTEVSAFDTFVEVVMAKKIEIFDSADLVVVTTADWQSEVALWAAKSDGTNWGIIQAWCEPHTHVGHVLFGPSGRFDARHLFTENGDFKSKLTDWPESGVVALPSCGESFIPGGALGIVNIASMVSQAAIRAINCNESKPFWLSHINNPNDVEIHGGVYLGPELPKGVQQAQLERNWPERVELGY